MDVPFIDLNRYEKGFHEKLYEKYNTILLNSQFIGGKEITELEKRLQSKLEIKHAITCANGTDAIQIALRAAGVGRGDTVLVPNFTFWATFEAVVNVGANPVTVDVELNDGGVSFEAFSNAVRTVAPKAAIVAHLFGWGSARLADLRQLCTLRDIILIEDGAQAFGVRYNGSSIFKHAKISTTSFYPAKVLGGAGDGGAVFTNDDDLAKKIRSLGNHGRATHYSYDDVGWNSRMDSLQASFLNVSLDHIESRIASRRKASDFYHDELRIEGIELIKAPDGFEENGYCNVCLISNSRLKQDLEASLKNEGIGFGNIYPGTMSSQKGASQYLKGHFGGNRAEQLCASVLNLPIFPYMRAEELRRVVEVVRIALERSADV